MNKQPRTISPELAAFAELVRQKIGQRAPLIPTPGTPWDPFEADAAHEHGTWHATYVRKAR